MLPHYLAKRKWSTSGTFMHISILVTILCFMSGSICFVSFYMLISFLPDTNIIMTLYTSLFTIIAIFVLHY